MPRTPDEWRDVVRALRAKADDKVTSEPEANALRAKATELEDKYCKSNSPPTNDTTTTSRDGNWTTYDEFLAAFYRTGVYDVYHAYMSSPQTTETYPTRPSRHTSGKSTTEDVWDILNKLRENQYQWNDRYYDKDGKPKPGYGGEEDIVEDSYREQPDEDNGYDMKEGDDW